MTFRSVNPATGEELQSFDVLDDGALDSRLDRAAEAFRVLREASFSERAGKMERAAGLLEDGRKAYARLMTLEMGKPIGQAVAEVEKCAWVCRHYAEHAGDYLAAEGVEADADRTWIRYRPLGPVLAVMPWNFPFWQVFRFAAPALMAGNVGLLKHAPNVPQCAVAIEGVFRKAGFGEGAFQNLFVETDRVPRILADDRVRAATLTGSARAGSAVASEAGRQIKKTVLELGGSDPFVMMPSADLERAVETAVRARAQNSGQSCIAAKRFVLHEAIADEFTEELVDRMDGLEVGDPQSQATDVGPLAREDLRDRLDRQVRETVEAGARVLLGGEPAHGSGWFYPPTVLDEVPDGTPAREEELFGPVATLLRVTDVGEAIRVANATPYGLGASVWTGDDEERARLLDGVEAGTVTVNGRVASDPRLPFGGVKASGFGRELGRHGIREFVNVQTVQIHEG
jgi:succinate-semialdehyde dehydrogenase/glutarate-semialdehyde dehydrogenase